MEGMFPLSNPARWQDHTVVKGGKSTLIRGKGKPSYLPGYITANTYNSPKTMAHYFTKLMRFAQPVEVVIAPPGYTVDGFNGHSRTIERMYMTVVSFAYGEAFGHPGSYVFTMDLKEWRHIQPSPPPKPPIVVTPTVVSDPVSSTVVTTKPKPKQPPPLKHASPVTPPQLSVYTVRTGDTLSDIAARYLGSSSRSSDIYNLNAALIKAECKKHGSSNYPKGWHIWPGMKLKIPPRNSHGQ
jgi:hypothetical protein